MNIFSKFFGGETEKQTLNQSDLELNHPEFNYELEFLQALNKSPASKLFGLNSYWEGRYQELLGNLKPIVSRFISNGFLVESLKEESLNFGDFVVNLRGFYLTMS